MAMIRHLLLSALLCVASSPTWSQANGLKSLETFVKTTQSGQAHFTQTVTVPARDGQPAKVKTSTGTFAFQRPNRFRFHYTKPFEQTIVADGQTLWLFDVDLNQVTARKQAQVLGSTPAALIAAAPDLKALQTEFTLKAAPDRDGLQWVDASPRAKDGQLQAVRVGFKPGANELAALEILDSFGQRSLIAFSQVEVNPVLAKDAFVFKPPAGPDVIRP